MGPAPGGESESVGRVPDCGWRDSWKYNAKPAEIKAKYLRWGAKIQTIEEANDLSHRCDWTSQGAADRRRKPVAEISTV